MAKVGRPKGSILKEKQCPGCGVVKPRSEFHKSSVKGRDSIRPKCKPCRNAEMREYYKKNPRKKAEQNARTQAWFKKFYAENVAPEQQVILDTFSTLPNRTECEAYAEKLLNSADNSVRYAIMHHEIEELLVEYTDY